MLRLSRRGIILSLFINSLNIALYLIILVAACLNIAEASVNFIILNGFAAAFACLLIVSEIRLPQLTYEYFRFLCTYRGRGMTYLFFGCLVASRNPFNLYGGIIVVCMGLAFFMLSYVTLIPPLDGFILNYKKLDQWKEQKHFRVRLEAQRIFEQQLQQEQNLARMIPAHHPNALTAHANVAMGSPKQLRTFAAINSSASAYFSGGTGLAGAGAGAGVGVGVGVGVDVGGPNTGNGIGAVTARSSGGAGKLKSMFTPPLSPSQRNGVQPLMAMDDLLQHQQQQYQHQIADQSIPPPPRFPHHQLQSRLQGSANNFGNSSQSQQQQPQMQSTRTSLEYLPLGPDPRFAPTHPGMQSQPDIVLTLPTPAEAQHGVRREYFAV